MIEWSCLSCASAALCPLRAALLGVVRACLRLVRVGLRLLTDRLELLRALGLLRLTGLDQLPLVEELTGDLLAEPDDLVEQAGRVLRVDAGDSHVSRILPVAVVRPFCHAVSVCPLAVLLTRASTPFGAAFVCDPSHSQNALTERLRRSQCAARCRTGPSPSPRSCATA